MTLYAIEGRDELLAVRFACSPVWETVAAIRTFIDERSRTYHEPWHRLVHDRVAHLDLAPLLATQPLHGYVPDFLTPPPGVAWPRLRDQLAEIRATPPEQVAHELDQCRRSVDRPQRSVLDQMLSDPANARDLLAARLQSAWNELVAPFWPRVRTLLEREIDQRSRTLAHHGLRRVVDRLHPQIRWTKDGVRIDDPHHATSRIGEKGLVLMPSAYVWPHVAAIIDAPWQPTIVYPAGGIAQLWHAPPPPPDALARVLGQTRALVLCSLDRPRSTTALAAVLELSPAGASRHLLALRAAGLIAASRHGHEVRYNRTKLGTALVSHTSRRAQTTSQETG
jgi:DNA-binding transcriptional ArsR family regulator